MGNWRRVWIVGQIPAGEVGPLRAALADAPGASEEWPEWHCLTIGEGLCGLGEWPAEVVNAVGNLHERDFSPEDVRDACELYVLPAAPGATLRVHCGGDWESSGCVGTVTVANGRATLGAPEIPSLPEIPETQIAGRLFAALARGGAS
jgi:hypothetical protein